MASLYTHQSENIRKTFFLFFVFAIVIVGVSYVINDIYDVPGLMFFAGVFVVIQSFVSYWFSDKIVLSFTGAKKIEFNDNPELYRLVENLCITAGLPMPKIYIINDPAPNAFATGRDKNHSAVAFTTGLLAMLERSELEGVVAHELAHIGNRDILLMTVATVLVGFISMLLEFVGRSIFLPSGDNEERDGKAVLVGIVILFVAVIFSQLIQFAISRKREYLADATGALLTRYPEGLANALRKITSYKGSMKKASTATAHLFISNPFGPKKGAVSKIAELFSTHPPVEKRIAKLLGQGL